MLESELNFSAPVPMPGAASPPVDADDVLGTDVEVTQPSPAPTTPTPLGVVLVNKLCLPLQTLVIRALPRTRRTRTPTSARTTQCSVRLAAKPHEADSTKQAQKILLQKLGTVVLPPVDSKVIKKFRATFSEPLSASKHEALQVLFNGDFDPASLGLDAVGVDDVAA